MPKFPAPVVHTMLTLCCFNFDTGCRIDIRVVLVPGCVQARAKESTPLFDHPSI